MNSKESPNLEQRLTDDKETIIALLQDSIRDNQPLVYADSENSLETLEYTTNLTHLLFDQATHDHWQVVYKACQFALEINNIAQIDASTLAIQSDFSGRGSADEIRQHLHENDHRYMLHNATLDELSSLYMPLIDPSGQFESEASVVISLISNQIQRHHEIGRSIEPTTGNPSTDSNA
ncbi:MAG: hypothetical protein ABIR91_01705 [Candidatus Saccharimonadales bacterium]